MKEMQVLSPGREDPLEKEMATLFSILSWETPLPEEPGGLQSTGSQISYILFLSVSISDGWFNVFFSLILWVLFCVFSFCYPSRDAISIWAPQFSWVQSLSRVCLCMDCSTPGLPIHHQLLEFTKLMSLESVMPSNHLILCRPLLLLPSVFPSIRGFSNDSALHIRWPKYWSFSCSISPSNEHPELISFRMDWLDLLAVQGTLKTVLQQHSSKASILQHSAFFIVHFSHPYKTTGKTIAPESVQKIPKM